MAFADAGHRPHAVHTGEFPKNPILTGPEGITVTLDAWGPKENLFPTLYDMLQSNWGDSPSRKADWRRTWEQTEPSDETGWNLLSGNEQAYVESLFAGKTLPQAKELISFSFCIDGVSRACTHQLVRTRIGAAFMQHGGRDNDWRHRPFRMPETIQRTINYTDLDSQHIPGRTPPITDILAIRRLQKDEADALAMEELPNLNQLIKNHLQSARNLYAALVDSGVPWQDARFLLPDGMTTYIHANYSYAALEGVLGNRLEHIMQWEINCVAQLMLREIRMKCPPLLSKYLGSRSDKSGRDEFAGLESWPPVGKYPTPDKAKDLPRTHRPEQNPFFVLHPDSMAGGPVRWVATNGTYPTEF